MSTEQSGPFGGLTPSEAGKRSWESRRAQKEREAVELNVGSDEKIEHALREKAERGDVAASRVLQDLGILNVNLERSQDQRFLELLTRAQRACIEATLRGQAVSPDEAIAAWCSS